MVSGTWGIMLIPYVLAISTMGMVLGTCKIMTGTQGKVLSSRVMNIIPWGIMISTLGRLVSLRVLTGFNLELKVKMGLSIAILKPIISKLLVC